MIKTLLALLMALFAATAFAAADANTASQAELDAVKGIGPSTATKIVSERSKGAFKDWPDLITRVKGIGDKNAVKLSAAGLTVNGSAMSGAPAAAAAPMKTPSKAATAAPAVVAAAPAPAAVATAATPASAPLSAADRKAAARQERDDRKAAKKAARAASASAAASASTKK